MTIYDLDVYKKTHSITLKLYEITSKFPKCEIYGLVSQIRRSAVSINSNLIEGSARVGKQEFKHFASIARGSAAELQYQILLSRDLKYISSEEHKIIDKEVVDILKMLSGLLK